MRFFGLFLCFCLLFGAGSFVKLAAAQSAIDGIAVIVNDDIVTVSDLALRVRLAIGSANLPDNPQTRTRITQKVLQDLVKERLQLQDRASTERRTNRKGPRSR